MTKHPTRIARITPLQVLAWTAAVICIAIVIVVTCIACVSAPRKVAGLDPLPALRWEFVR